MRWANSSNNTVAESRVSAQTKPNQTKPNQTKPSQTKPKRVEMARERKKKPESGGADEASTSEGVPVVDKWDRIVSREESDRVVAQYYQKRKQALRQPVDIRASPFVHIPPGWGKEAKTATESKQVKVEGNSTGDETSMPTKQQMAEGWRKPIQQLPGKKSPRHGELVKLTDPERKYQRGLLFMRMREYVPLVQAGEDVKTIKKPDGNLLSYEERCVLMRITPKSDNIKTGRSFVQEEGGYSRATGYECNVNLAGRFFVVSQDGVMVEVPIAMSDQCGHELCRKGYNIRPGVARDAVFMVLPQNYTSMSRGIMTAEAGGTVKSWNEMYHQAVLAVKLARDVLPYPKFRALMGHKYIPSSRFAEAIVFIARVLGLQDVGFLRYSQNTELFDSMVKGQRGVCDAFSYAMMDVLPDTFERMSNYAWGLHHLCQLKSLYPECNIPFQMFLVNMDRFSRKTSVAARNLAMLYETEGVLTDMSELAVYATSGKCHANVPVVHEVVRKLRDRSVTQDERAATVIAMIDGSRYSEYAMHYRRTGLSAKMLDLEYSHFFEQLMYEGRLTVMPKYIVEVPDPPDGETIGGQTVDVLSNMYRHFVLSLVEQSSVEFGDVAQSAN